MESIFHKLVDCYEASAVIHIEQLADLSLIQYNSNNDKYYMHPYIQEYAQRKSSGHVNKMKFRYFVEYDSKFMEVTKDQIPV